MTNLPTVNSSLPAVTMTRRMSEIQTTDTALHPGICTFRGLAPNPHKVIAYTLATHRDHHMAWLQAVGVMAVILPDELDGRCIAAYGKNGSPCVGREVALQVQSMACSHCLLCTAGACPAWAWHESCMVQAVCSAHAHMPTCKHGACTPCRVIAYVCGAVSKPS